MSRTMLNCGASGRIVFDYRCPLTWDALTPTDEPRQRDCAQCRRTVHWCSNLADASLRAAQGECIAVPAWVAEGVREAAARRRGDGRIIIGMVGVRGGSVESDLLTEAVERRDGPTDLWRR